MSLVVRASHPGGPEVLETAEEEPGKPGGNEVLLRQTAIGLNFMDTYFRTGLYPFPVDGPLVPGGEAAGEVVEAGAQSGLQPGDRVAYVGRTGAYRAMRVMPADMLVRVPPDVADEVAAAAMLKGLTAWYLVEQTYRVKPGEFVLVHAAAGGVGLILGQWLASIGAIAIGTTSPAKAALAQAHGYTHVIPYEGFVAKVDEITDGKGCSVVYDGVGRDTYPGSLQCLRRRGLFVAFGQSSGVIERFRLADLAAYGSLSATRPSLYDYVATREELEEGAHALFSRIVQGQITLQVNQRFALADAAEAHRALEARETTGSTVLIP